VLEVVLWFDLPASPGIRARTGSTSPGPWEASSALRANPSSRLSWDPPTPPAWPECTRPERRLSARWLARPGRPRDPGQACCTEAP